MSFTLSDGSTTINLYPKWDFKHNRKMDRSDHRMYDGSLFSYKWCAYDLFSMTVEGLTPTEAAQINTWWEALTTLTFTLPLNGADMGIPVSVGGNSTPFPKFLSPRVDYYQGKLELTSLFSAGLFVYLLVDHEGAFVTTSSGDYIGVLSR